MTGLTRPNRACITHIRDHRGMCVCVCVRERERESVCVCANFTQLCPNMPKFARLNLYPIKTSHLPRQKDGPPACDMSSTSSSKRRRPAWISCRVRSNVVMRRVSCLELEVFGARAPVCKAECVQIMNGFDDLVAFMSIKRLNMQTFHQRNISNQPKYHPNHRFNGLD